MEIMEVIESAVEDGPEPDIDLSAPQDILFSVIVDEGRTREGWNRFSVDEVYVLTELENTIGPADFEDLYSGFLNYTIESLADCPNKEGWFVMVGFTSSFHKGDGWMTDDDMDFDFESVREATPEEYGPYVEDE